MGDVMTGIILMVVLWVAWAVYKGRDTGARTRYDYPDRFM